MDEVESEILMKCGNVCLCHNEQPRGFLDGGQSITFETFDQWNGFANTSVFGEINQLHSAEKYSVAHEFSICLDNTATIAQFHPLRCLSYLSVRQESSPLLQKPGGE